MGEKIPDLKEQRQDNLVIGAKSGVVAFVMRLAYMALGLLNQVALARILGVQGIGEVTLILTILGTAVTLALFGMEVTLVRFVPFYVEKKENAKLKGAIYFILKFCCLLSIACVALILIFSKFISIDIFHSKELLNLLPIAAFITLPTVINDLISAALKGYKDTFRSLLPRCVIAPLLRLMIFLILSLKNVSTSYAIIAVIFSEILTMFFSLKFLFKKINKVKPEYQRSEYKKILGVASTSIFTGFSVLLFTQSDLWIVGMFSTTEAVGIYGVVSRLVILISFSLGAFATIIPSIISSVHTSGDHGELKRVIKESTRWILTISMPLGLFFILEGKIILKYAFGEGFVGGYMALVILTFGQLINAGTGLVGWFLQMTGGHKAFMNITIFWGILNIVLNIILVPQFGINGAALATAFCLSMVNIVSVWVVYKKYSVVTLAKGMKFDVVFASVITIFYLLFSYKHFYIGYHLLLIVALVIYIWRAIVNGDLPWRYILAKYKIK